MSSGKIEIERNDLKKLHNIYVRGVTVNPLPDDTEQFYDILEKYGVSLNDDEEFYFDI